MTIYFGKTSRLKAYTAAVKGAKSVVKIEIEITDAYELAGLLKDLGDITRYQKEAGRKKPLAIEDLRGRP